MCRTQRIATYFLWLTFCAIVLTSPILSRDASRGRSAVEKSLRKRTATDMAESQQVSVVASNVFYPAESGHGQGYHKRHKGHHHHAKGHKSNKGIKHHKSHKGSKHGHHSHHGKKGHHHDGGKHDKGKHHKSDDHHDQYSGKKGYTGYGHEVKGQSKKYDKGGGYKHFRSKAEKAKKKSFYDDSDRHKWDEIWNDEGKYFKGTKAESQTGNAHKAGNHFDKYGKKGHFKKGSYHDKEGGHKTNHKHKQHHGHHEHYGKKGGHKKGHGFKKHHGHGDHGHHGHYDHHGHYHDHHDDYSLEDIQVHHGHENHGQYGQDQGYHDHEGAYSIRNTQVCTGHEDHDNGNHDDKHGNGQNDQREEYNHVSDEEHPRHTDQGNYQEQRGHGGHSNARKNKQRSHDEGYSQSLREVQHGHKQHDHNTQHGNIEQEHSGYHGKHALHTDQTFPAKPVTKFFQSEPKSYQLFTFIPVVRNPKSKYPKTLKKSSSTTSKVDTKLSKFASSEDDKRINPFRNLNFESSGEFVNVTDLLKQTVGFSLLNENF